MLTRHHLTIVSPLLSHKCITVISAISHHYHTRARPAYSTSTLHHCTSISPASHQHLASISPVSHHPNYLPSVRRASHQYHFTSISLSFRQYLTSTLVSHHDPRSFLIAGLAPRQVGRHHRIAFVCTHGCHRSASTVALWLVMTGLGPQIAAYASAVACERHGAAELQTLACMPQTDREQMRTRVALSSVARAGSHTVDEACDGLEAIRPCIDLTTSGFLMGRQQGQIRFRRRDLIDRIFVKLFLSLYLFDIGCVCFSSCVRTAWCRGGADACLRATDHSRYT